MRFPSLSPRGSVSMVQSSALESAHAATVDRLVDALQLDDWDYASSFGVDALTREELRCTMRGFESPTKSGVAWCSALAVARGVDDDCIIDECRADTVWRSDISCWNAPVDDVPHLLAAVTVEASGVSLSLEFLPRADGGYDRSVEAAGGAYAEPASREAFAMAAVRADLEDKYFGADAFRWRAGVLLGGETSGGRGGYGAAALPWRGPLCLECRLPLEQFDTCIAARESAIDLWLGWKGEARARPLDHVATTRVYKRDTKLREAHTKFSEKKFCDAFGYILGQSIASVHACPEEMAKHSQLGQGSGGGMV